MRGSIGDEKEDVRYNTIIALARIGDKRAIPALEKVAANDPAQDSRGRFHLREQARYVVEHMRASAAKEER